MAAEKNRINVSLSASCLVEIDNHIAAMQMFNGHAEFVFSAIRNFYISCIARFRGYLTQSEQEGQTPLEIITMFDEATERYGYYLLSSYADVYPGQNAIQVIIRPKDLFYGKIRELSRYLFKTDEKENLIKTCRVAVFWYLGKLNETSSEDTFFETELNELRSKVKKNSINLGI